MKKTVGIALAALALAACKPRPGAAPTVNQDAIKALGGAVPEPDYDRAYWLKRHDASTPEWQEAKRLCGQTVLANYPNCLPVNDIVQADQKKQAEAGNRAAAKNEEMLRRGYLYDFARKVWLQATAIQSAGCIPVPAYPSDPNRIGFSTWKCPAGVAIPKGIPDPNFRKEEENATD
jgi:hypothetical protein